MPEPLPCPQKAKLVGETLVFFVKSSVAIEPPFPALGLDFGVMFLSLATSPCVIAMMVVMADQNINVVDCKLHG